MPRSVSLKPSRVMMVPRAASMLKVTTGSARRAGRCDDDGALHGGAANLEARSDVSLERSGGNLASARAADLGIGCAVGHGCEDQIQFLISAAEALDQKGERNLLECSRIRGRAAASKDVTVEVRMPRVQVLEVCREKLVAAEMVAATLSVE